jgi:hypothetical protein
VSESIIGTVEIERLMDTEEISIVPGVQRNAPRGAVVAVSNFARIPLCHAPRLPTGGRLSNIGEVRFRRPSPAFCIHARYLRARFDPFDRREETYNMQTHYPFHAEYWVYALAVFVIIVLGTLLYTVDGPIKFSSWFCRSFTLTSPVISTVPPSRPDSGGDRLTPMGVRQLAGWIDGIL